MPNTTLLDPTSQGDVSAKFLAPRLDNLDGKVMGLLNITKNGSDIFLDRIAELMQERFELAEVIHVKKPTFTRPAPTELLAELAEQADFVIEGLADWGSCISCSMHDGSALEERGVPSVAVCTEVFFAAGKVQARVLGHGDLEPLTVPHPIQSLTPDQIRERAEGAVEEIVTRLTKNGEA